MDFMDEKKNFWIMCIVVAVFTIAAICVSIFG